MAANPKILVGADPELFLRDSKTKQLVAAKIPGTKLTPYKVERGAIQVDGAAAEFNIDPAATSTTFVTNIRHVLDQMKGHTQGLEFVLDPTATFEPTYFSTLPAEVRELGCNPDFNAWTGQVNPKPDGDVTTMRTASGHIHVGWCKNVNPMDAMHFDDCVTVIKQLDYYLGLPSLWWDPDNKRRQLYGKAGAFRPKPYGAEYRTLSNVWLRSEPLQVWIFNAVTRAVNDLLSGKKPMTEMFKDYARKVIDNNEVNWFQTPEGKKVWATVGMLQPPVQECLSYGKEAELVKPAPAPRTRKKKADPFHQYEVDN